MMKLSATQQNALYRILSEDYNQVWLTLREQRKKAMAEAGRKVEEDWIANNQPLQDAIKKYRTYQKTVAKRVAALQDEFEAAGVSAAHYYDGKRSEVTFSMSWTLPREVYARKEKAEREVAAKYDKAEKELNQARSDAERKITLSVFDGDDIEALIQLPSLEDLLAAVA